MDCDQATQPDCDCPLHAETANSLHRRSDLAVALRLEYLTVAWNLIEGIVAVGAASAAASIALLGFGIDSFVEMSSGLVLVWRLRAESRHRAPIDLAALDRRAHRLVGASLLALAAYVAFEGARSLLSREMPAPSGVGLALTAVSLPVMLWLGRAKRRRAQALGSRAMESDAFQTTACMWLSATTLCGVGLNALLGWWWADPAAALLMSVFLVKEGREAWRGNPCACVTPPTPG
jgi:divalent metal cation (Fe/Co/Zn/Cd) transporter